MGTYSSSFKGNNTYLELQFEAGEEEDSLIIGMLNNNTINNVLPMQVAHRNIDNYIENIYMYNISGLMPLKYVYEDSMVKRVFLGIMQGIIEALIDAKEYMLTSENMEWSYEHIYVDQKTSMAKLICIPKITDDDFDVYSFMRNFVFNAKLDPSENGAYQSEIIRFLNNCSRETFSYEEFLVLLKKLSSNSSQVAERTSIEAFRTRETEIKSKIQTTTEYQHNNEIVNQPTIGGVTQSKKITQPVVDTKTEVKPVFKQTVKQESVSSFEVPVSEGAEDGFFVPGMDTFEPTNSKKNNLKETVSAKEIKEKQSVISFGSLNKISSLFGKNKKEATKPSSEIDIPGIASEPVVSNVQNFKSKAIEVVPTQGQITNNKLSNSGGNRVTNSERTVFFDQDVSAGGQTIMMDMDSIQEKADKTPYLFRKKNNEKIKIVMVNGRFKIGRNAESGLQYVVDNVYIGGFHAQIVLKNDNYFVLDMNTKNGTYVDSQRIIVGEEKLLTPGCSLKLANEEFEFIIE